MSSGAFTCISCRVGFIDGDIQRAHYKTDWHRYNLKRKVAELPPVSAEVFQEKVLSQRAKLAEQEKDTAKVCDLCSKHFSSENAYQNHIQSKKHKEIAVKAEHANKNTTDQENNERAHKDSVNMKIKSDLKKAETYQQKQTHKDKDISDDDDSDVEEWEGDALGLEECLFCSMVSSSMENNINHMSIKHGFFIPDADYLVDLEGLISYLGEKVGIGHVCLWCNEKGKRFNDVQSVQKHMVDKGHCKILHEKEDVVEFTDFYDYRSSYPDNDETAMETDQEVEENTLDTDGYELVLPSGAKVGHRSLQRYYRQNLPNKPTENTKSLLPKMLAQYKALGWTGTTGEVAQQRVKDLAFMQRLKNKNHMHLGVKANKFQPHFRPQVVF